MNNCNILRVLWSEQLNKSIHQTYPEISFDGNNWISGKNPVDRLRNAPMPDGIFHYIESKTNNEITNVGNNWYKMDVYMSPAIETIPFIVSHTLTIATGRNKKNGFTPGTYYFSVASDTFKQPNFNDASNERYIKYHSNPSKVYKIVIPESDIEETWIIDFYISYPEYIAGLLIYCSKEDEYGNWENMVLKYISNVKTTIHRKMPYQENETDVLYGRDEIWLENGMGFPSSGVIRIGNEYLSYDDKTYFKIPDGSYIYKLTGVLRGLRNTNSREQHVVGDVVSLSDFEEGYDKGVLPRLVYPVNYDYKTTRLVEALNYNSLATRFISDIMNNPYEVKPKEIGLADSITQTMESNYYKGAAIQLNGKSCVDLGLKYLNSATISFHIKMTNNTVFNGDDIGVFGHRKGLWIKLSETTKKLYLGVSNKTLFKHNDSRLPSLIRNEWVNIIISYEIVDSNIKLLYCFNGSIIAEINEKLSGSEDDYVDVTTLVPYLGALSDSGGDPILFFTGQMDEYKYFDYSMTNIEILNYYSKSIMEFQRFTGRVTLLDKIHNTSVYNTITFENHEGVIKNNYIDSEEAFSIGTLPNLIQNVGLIKDEKADDLVRFEDKIIVYLDGRRLVRQSPWHDIFDYHVDTENMTIVFGYKTPCYPNSKLVIMCGDANRFDPKYDLIVNATSNTLYKNKLSPTVIQPDVKITINEGEQCFINSVIDKNSDMFVYGKFIYNTSEIDEDLVYRQLTKTIKFIENIDYTAKPDPTDPNSFTITIINEDYINLITKPLVAAYDSRLVQLSLYATDQEGIISRMDEWLLDDGYMQDYKKTPYPVLFNDVKLRFPMTTKNTLTSPRIKNLSIIVSTKTFED